MSHSRTEFALITVLAFFIALIVGYSSKLVIDVSQLPTNSTTTAVEMIETPEFWVPNSSHFWFVFMVAGMATFFGVMLARCLCKCCCRGEDDTDNGKEPSRGRVNYRDMEGGQVKYVMVQAEPATSKKKGPKVELTTFSSDEEMTAKERKALKKQEKKDRKQRAKWDAANPKDNRLNETLARLVPAIGDAATPDPAGGVFVKAGRIQSAPSGKKSKKKDTRTHDEIIADLKAQRKSGLITGAIKAPNTSRRFETITGLYY